MTSRVDHHMTEIYCFVDDFLQTHPALACWRRSPPGQPPFSAAEVLTTALLQGMFAVATLQQTSCLVARNWGRACPTLPTDKPWVARWPRWWPQVGRVLAATWGPAPTAARLSLIDSKPIPLCAPIRHGRVRLVRDEGADCGKTTKGWFCGFKLPRLRHSSGRVLTIILTPGNWDDRDPALAVGQTVDGGVTLGDLGYRGPACATSLADDAAMLLSTRDRAPEPNFVLRQVRHGIETTFSQLWWKLIDRVFSRSWHGLWNTIQLKVLYYNLVHAGLVSA